MPNPCTFPRLSFVSVACAVAAVYFFKRGKRDVDPSFKKKKGCLPRKASHVTITATVGMEPRVMVDGKDFLMKGMGYSPIVPGKDTRNQPFDYFTDLRSHIWKRDLRIIAGMGANIVRLWSWDISKDHLSFLNECMHNNLMVLVPFSMDAKEFENIADPDTHKKILTGWRALVKSVHHHPALFGYLIGNEVNEEFGGQLEALLSIVNSMVDVRNDEDPHMHPITVPFSDNNFLEILVDKYYPWLNIDYWSLQIYRSGNEIQQLASDYNDLFTTISSNYTMMDNSSDYTMVDNTTTEFDNPEPDYVFVNGKNQGIPKKPIVITEFGVDALSNKTCKGWGPTCGVENITTLTSDPNPIPEDQLKQAYGICERYNKIKSNTAGGVVMEFVDEWWKGSLPDIRTPGCPSRRPDVHSYCGFNLNKNITNSTANILHEEWLGIFKQVLAQKDSYAIFQDMQYCIQPRLSYCVMKEMFSGNDDSCTEVIIKCNSNRATWDEESCASALKLVNNVFVMLVAPCILVLVVVLGVMYFQLGRSATEIVGAIVKPFWLAISPLFECLGRKCFRSSSKVHTSPGEV